MFKVGNNSAEHSHAVLYFCLHRPVQSNQATGFPKTTSRPVHLHISSGTENPPPSPCPSLRPLRSPLFPVRLTTAVAIFSPSLIHYNHFPFSPSGIIVVCSTFHKAVQPLLSTEICIRKSFASEETLHHYIVYSRMSLHHNTTPVLRNIFFPLA